jgi:hypothetical protein
VSSNPLPPTPSSASICLVDITTATAITVVLVGIVIGVSESRVWTSLLFLGRRRVRMRNGLEPRLDDGLDSGRVALPRSIMANE